MPTETVFRTMREQIVEYIRKDLLGGDLKEGDPLREKELAERFGVSRGPVRDALLQLTQEGLLVARPNRGVVVGSPPSEVTQPLAVDLRRRIETFAIERLLDKGLVTDEAISDLEEILERLRTDCEQGDLSAISEHDMAFHKRLVELVGDDDLTAMWTPITARMVLHYSRHKDMIEDYEEHAAILAAIRAGDKKAAVKALETNIR